MTPQRRRQEERRRQAGQATATGMAAALSHGGKGRAAHKKKSNVCKTIAWVALTVFLLAVAGVLIWYFAFYKKSLDKNSSGNSGGDVARGPTVVTPNGTVFPNENYPLKRVFYGMAYVPQNAQLPGCFSTQQSANDELKLLVQTTRRVRLYGTDCSVLRFTMDSIQRLKLDLQVVVGIWIDRDNATFTRQSIEFFSLMSTYDWSNIIGVFVGNEVIYDKYQPLEVLMAHVADVKAKVVAAGHADIPVFTSDLESANKPPLTSHEDNAGVNLHPFFAGAPVSEAAVWFWKYLEESVAPVVNSDNTNPIEIWITEVGWPTLPVSDSTNSSIPSIPNLQTFLDTWLCDANAKNLPYYYFEFFDAPWKIWPGHAVEGLLTIDKKLKVKLLDCLAS